MSGIFISYRREDTPGYAGWVAELLRKHFGPAEVFMDLDSIEPGMDFVTVIENAVGSCDALIALMGKNWLTVAGANHRRRLDNPEDYVRLEITSALNRDIRVIPALVQDAAMPRSEDLPDALKPLARRNAIELSDSRFGYDMERLIRTLEEVLQVAPTPLPVKTLKDLDAADDLEQANERLKQLTADKEVPPAPQGYSLSGPAAVLLLAAGGVFVIHALLWLTAFLTAFGHPFSEGDWWKYTFQPSPFWGFYHGWPDLAALVVPGDAINQQWWALIVCCVDAVVAAGCFLLAGWTRRNEVLLQRQSTGPTLKVAGSK